MYKQKIHFSISESIRAIQDLYDQMDTLDQMGKEVAECFKAGKKVLIAGNGGSLCDASHFAEELTGFFRKYRPALPVIALADPSHITCVANDVDFKAVFSRSVEAFGQEGDIFIGLSTSGNSQNIIKALETAKMKKLKTFTFLGKSGGLLKGQADLEILIADFNSSDRIQEAHMTALHIIVEIVEYHLFGEKTSVEAFSLENTLPSKQNVF